MKKKRLAAATRSSSLAASHQPTAPVPLGCILTAVLLVPSCTGIESDVCHDGSICPAGTTCVDIAQATLCVLEECGDGFVNQAAGEICDDGNNLSGDGCRGDCQSTEICGNGRIDHDAEENCDDGNTVTGDGCSDSCQSEPWSSCTPTVYEAQTYLLCQDPLSWPAARDDCAQRGYHLATIGGSKLNHFLYNTAQGLSPEQRWWFGFNSLREHDVWEWVDGSEVTLNQWATGQPNDFMGAMEDCAHFGDYFKEHWNDHICSNEYFYICERAAQR